MVRKQIFFKLFLISQCHWLTYSVSVVLLSLFVATPAQALPIPEFASAAFGIGEVFLFLFALMGLYLPFRSRRNRPHKLGAQAATKRTHWLIALLVLSVGANAYYFSTSFLDNFQKSKEFLAVEERPGMRWTQEQRDSDIYAIPEDKAYQILLKEQSEGNTDYIFIDARSRAETELGTVPGFVKIRWADVLERAEEFRGKTVIATCWTGMRGSEVCEKLREHGINCLYLKEGLSGWTKQGLPVELGRNTTVSDFGTSETFPNSYTLLSTRQAVEAKLQGAAVVDVRSATEFAKSSIPGSINLPYDSLSTPQLEYQIDSLPAQPIMVACYGVVSCNEANALGWEMNRLGVRYIGSYTGGIAAFQDILNNQKVSTQANSFYHTMHTKTVKTLRTLTQEYSLNALILLTSVILGVCLYLTKELSFSYFRELKIRQAKNSVLKRSYPEDNWLWSRERQKNYKEELKHLGPNLLIVILALFYGLSLEVIFEAWGGLSFWGIEHWSEKTGFSLLSAIGAASFTFGLSNLLLKKKIKWIEAFVLNTTFFVIGLIVFSLFSQIGVLFFTTTLIVMYAIQALRTLYDYIVLLKIKSQIKKGCLSLEAWGELMRLTKRHKNTQRGLKLLTVSKQLNPNTKAGRLAQLLSKGWSVPTGFVVLGPLQSFPPSKTEQTQQNLDSDRVLKSNRSEFNFDSKDNQSVYLDPTTIQHIQKKLGSVIAVRSSAIGEDSEHSSQAGLHLSIVPGDIDTLNQDIEAVFQSYLHTVSNNSSDQNNKSIAPIQMKESQATKEVVLVQQLINPIVSGVAFSHHPTQGGVILIEWGTGLSGARMEGSEVVEHIVLERHSGEIISQSVSLEGYPELKNSIKELYNLILEIENLYGTAIDIEWAIATGNKNKGGPRDMVDTSLHLIKKGNDKAQLWLLQARPQTALDNLSYNSIEVDKNNILTQKFKSLKTNELSASMAGATRLSASLLTSLWATGGSADKASRMAQWQWTGSITEQTPYIYLFGKIWVSDYVFLETPNQFAFYMAKRDWGCQHAEIKEDTVRLLNENKIYKAVDWNSLDKTSWLTLWNNCLHNWHTLQEYAFYFEFMAQAHTERIVKELKTKYHIDDYLPYLQIESHNFYTTDTAYRADQDYEISMPRYIELSSYSKEMVDTGAVKTNSFETNTLPQEKRTNSSLTDPLPTATQKELLWNKELVYLREQYKHYALELFYSLRRATLSLQLRTGWGEAIFELEQSEVPALLKVLEPESQAQKNEDNVQSLVYFKDLLQERLSSRKVLQSLRLPVYMTATDIALFNWEECLLTGTAVNTDNLNNKNQGREKLINELNKSAKPGVFISNAQDIKGQLIILPERATPQEVEAILHNQQALAEEGLTNGPIILYAVSISPQIVQLAQRYKVAALCSQYGSLLSHPAVLSREAHMPFLTQVMVPPMPFRNKKDNQPPQKLTIHIEKSGFYHIQ